MFIFYCYFYYQLLITHYLLVITQFEIIFSLFMKDNAIQCSIDLPKNNYSIYLPYYSQMT